MASSSSSWWIIGGLSCARSRADDGRRLFRVDPFFVEADGTDLRRRPRRRFAPAAAPVCGRGIVPIARWARAQPQLGKIWLSPLDVVVNDRLALIVQPD